MYRKEVYTKKKIYIYEKINKKLINNINFNKQLSYFLFLIRLYVYNELKVTQQIFILL